MWKYVVFTDKIERGMLGDPNKLIETAQAQVCAFINEKQLVHSKILISAVLKKLSVSSDVQVISVFWFDDEIGTSHQ